MARVEIGKTGLAGWRDKVAEAVADPLSKRTPLRGRRALSSARCSS